MKWINIGPGIVFVVCCLAALPAVSLGCPQAGAQERAESMPFSTRSAKQKPSYFEAVRSPSRRLWSRASDVTLFGVSSGSGEHGWEQVGPRLDWTNTQYFDGTLTVERIASYVDGNLGYVVQREKVRFKAPGHTQESILEIRANRDHRRDPRILYSPSAAYSRLVLRLPKRSPHGPIACRFRLSRRLSCNLLPSTIVMEL